MNVYLGEKNFDGIKKVMGIAIKTALLSGVVLIPTVFVFSANLAGLFSLSDAIRFDLTDEKINSFRSFFLYSFLEGSKTDRSYLMTQNYNSHIFTLINE